MARRSRSSRSRINNFRETRRDVSIPSLNYPSRRLPRLLPRLVAASGEDHRVHLPKNAIRRLRNLAAVPVRPRVRFRSLPRNAKAYRDVYLGGLRSKSLSFDFVLPRDAVVCARRKIRREVIFAKGKAGRGGQRKPRFNERSKLVCR